MEKLKRGDKIYLDKNNTKESAVNFYLSGRDGIVEVFEYDSVGGYGNPTRLFLCQNTKHESISLIRQTLVENVWLEEVMSFDSDSFKFLEELITGDVSSTQGGYTKVRDYNTEI